LKADVKKATHESEEGRESWRSKERAMITSAINKASTFDECLPTETSGQKRERERESDSEGKNEIGKVLKKTVGFGNGQFARSSMLMGGEERERERERKRQSGRKIERRETTEKRSMLWINVEIFRQEEDEKAKCDFGLSCCLLLYVRSRRAAAEFDGCGNYSRTGWQRWRTPERVALTRLTTARQTTRRRRKKRVGWTNMVVADPTGHRPKCTRTRTKTSHSQIQIWNQSERNRSFVLALFTFGIWIERNGNFFC
jgi:hypothetical protein